MRCSLPLTLLSASLTLAQPTRNLTGTIPLYGEDGLNENIWTSENPSIKVRIQELHGGQQEGSVLLTVQTPSMIVRLVPTRGMNILNVTDEKGVRLGGWDSGVTEIVNPVYLNQMDRAGSGFLAGFNEMVVRCGFEYVGHAGEDGDDGLLTLHGKIANTPVSTAEIAYDNTAKVVTVTATTLERAFKKSYFTAKTTIDISTEQKVIKLSDTLINEGAYEAEYMALYHSNFGTPLLSAKNTLHIPAREVSPFNEAARDGLEEWDKIFEPTDSYDETVYNIFPYADEKNMTTVAMINADEKKGLQMDWSITNLPALSLWKNLDLEKLGYVVGLEPGTSFSYNRKFQRPLNLVPTLAPGASVTFEITYTFLDLQDEAAIKVVTDKIATIQSKGETTKIDTPLSDEIEEGESSGAEEIIFMSTIFSGMMFVATHLF